MPKIVINNEERYQSLIYQYKYCNTISYFIILAIIDFRINGYRKIDIFQIIFKQRLNYYTHSFLTFSNYNRYFIIYSYFLRYLISNFKIVIKKKKKNWNRVID